jgi:hypothetical protein
LQHVSSDGIISAGRKEVYAVSTIAIGHIVRDEVVVGVGKVYSIPALPDYAVKAGIVSCDCIAAGKDQGNAGLCTVDYGIAGYYAARHVVELYSIKSVSDHKATDAHVIRIYVYAGIPISSPDNRTIAHQIHAFLYGYFIVDSGSYQQSIARGGSIDR